MKISPKSIGRQAGCHTLPQGDTVGAPQSSGLRAAHGPGTVAGQMCCHWMARSRMQPEQECGLVLFTAKSEGGD